MSVGKCESALLYTCYMIIYLGILIASAVFGIATASTKEIGQPFFKFFYAATEIILVILGKLIW